MTKLDYTLTTFEERNNLVKQILAETPPSSLTPSYLEILSDYLILCLTKQEKREKTILTENRLATINKRETSLEGLISTLENGEDGIYSLLDENNKQAIFHPKISITPTDLSTIPELRDLREAIQIWENISTHATGQQAYVAKRAVIDLRRQQYLIKESYHPTVNSLPHTLGATSSSSSSLLEDRTHTFDSDGYPIPEGISLLDPSVVSAVLCNYLDLRKSANAASHSDTWYFLENFDHLRQVALASEPLYTRLVQLKMQELPNAQIQAILNEEFHILHSLEYISSLWRKKIPKLIASAAEDEFLDNYYLNVAKGKYKKCSRCGQIKLAHLKYFSKNKTSKDGFYSICKECRRKKGDK